MRVTARRQGQIKGNEGVQGPDERCNTQKPGADLTEREAIVEAVDERHEIDDPLRDVAKAAPAEPLTAIGVQI